MSQLALPFFVAVAVTLFVSRFAVPVFIKNIPIPVQIFQTINIVFTVIIFISSFGSLYYLHTSFNEHVSSHAVPQQFEQIPLNVLTANAPHPSDAKREAARVLALEALRQGTALSVIISKLPKLAKIHQGALRLLEISPRYQDKVSDAEKDLNSASEMRDKILGVYLNKVVELGRYKPDYTSFALDSIRNGDLTPRERIVFDLFSNHVNTLHNGTQADPAHWFSEFTEHFSEFVD